MKTEIETTAEIPDRRAKLLEAALAVFSEKGVANAKIGTIVERAEASVGSLYHHFGTKEGLAAELFVQGLDQYWTQLKSNLRNAKSGRDVVSQLITSHIQWIMNNQDMARFLFGRRQAVSPEHEAKVRTVTGAHFKGLMAILQPHFRSGEFRQLPMELYAPVLMGPVQEMSRAYLSGRSKTDPSGLIDELVEVAYRGIATHPVALTSPDKGVKNV